MTAFSRALREFLQGQRWSWVARRWPCRALLRRLERGYEAECASTLLADLRVLEQMCRPEKYAQATNTLLLKPQRAITKLANEVISAARKNRSGTNVSVGPLQLRYQELLAEVKRLLQQDQKWRKLAARLRAERTELWEEASRRAPLWQQTVTGLVAEVDDALRFAPRIRNPEEELQQAAHWVARIRTELAYLRGVDDLQSACDKATTRLEKMSPIDGSYLQHDLTSFRDTLEVGRSCFSSGEYSAAQRHFRAAHNLAKEILRTELAERRKRRSEAHRWLDILERDHKAGQLPEEISTVLCDFSSPGFLNDWEQLHRRIDAHVLAEACAMGKHDQKEIAKRLGTKTIVKWGAKLNSKELKRFAQAVVETL